MTDKRTDVSMKSAALITGSALLLMAVFAGYAYGYVFQSLIVAGDAVRTVSNLVENAGLYRSGLFGFLIVLILDVVVAWGLYVILKRANRGLALLIAWLRLVYAALLSVALWNCVLVLSALESTQSEAQVMHHFEAFDRVWSMGLVVFGCHLLVLGYLVIRSGYVPKVFGVLLVIASVCYLSTSGANLLMSNYTEYRETVESVLGGPMAVGELAFAFWLLIKGRRLA